MKVGNLKYVDLAKRVIAFFNAHNGNAYRVVDLRKQMKVTNQQKRQFIVRFLRALVKAGAVTRVSDGRGSDFFYKVADQGSLNLAALEIESWEERKGRKKLRAVKSVVVTPKEKAVSVVQPLPARLEAFERRLARVESYLGLV